MTQKACSPNKTNKINNNNNNRRKLRTEQFSSTWMKNKWKKKIKNESAREIKEWMILHFIVINWKLIIIFFVFFSSFFNDNETLILMHHPNWLGTQNIISFSYKYNCCNNIYKTK